MDQTTQSRVNSLNKRWFADLGYTPFGDLKWQWMHTTDMPFYIRPEGMPSLIVGANGLPFVDTSHAHKLDMSLVLGECWVIAAWKPPMDESEWQSNPARARFPWPRHGEYIPIENMTLPAGVEPDEFETKRAIRDIRRHLDKVEQTKRGLTDGVRQLVEESKERRAAQDKSARSTIESMIDDDLTAFGKIPGREDGGVGLGYSRKRILDSGGTPIEELAPAETVQ